MKQSMTVFQNLEILRIELFPVGGAVPATASTCLLIATRKMGLLLFLPEISNHNLTLRFHILIPLLLFYLQTPYHLSPPLQHWLLRTQNKNLIRGCRSYLTTIHV